MEKKKLTLEDLKLESFLTELDDSKSVKVQGGMGGYGSDQESDDRDNDEGPYGDRDLTDNIEDTEDPGQYYTEYSDTPYDDPDLTDNIEDTEDPGQYYTEY